MPYRRIPVAAEILDMGKRRSYEEKLLDDLLLLEPNRWYRVDNRPDCKKLTEAVKSMIDKGEPFEFSNDYTKIRMQRSYYRQTPWHEMDPLPAGITIEVIEPGTKEEVMIKGTQHILEHEKKSYRIFKNKQLIAIE